MSDHRLPDEDLTVLVDRAARGYAEANGYEWQEAEDFSRNLVRERALPFIFHGTKALHELGYRKPRTITTVEELDALAIESVVLDEDQNACQKFTEGMWDSGDLFLTDEMELPVIVLWEPQS